MSIIRDSLTLSLRAAMDLRMQRQEMLTHNLANADTPDFVPRDLEFEGALRRAIQPTGNQPENALAQPIGVTPFEPLIAPRPTDDQRVVGRPEVIDSLDGNAVDPDKETARIADNSMHYQAQVSLLNRRYSSIQRIISGLSGV
jgi:flagellar basal-body rod protein FlgB